MKQTYASGNWVGILNAVKKGRGWELQAFSEDLVTGTSVWPTENIGWSPESPVTFRAKPCGNAVCADRVPTQTEYTRLVQYLIFWAAPRAPWRPVSVLKVNLDRACAEQTVHMISDAPLDVSVDAEISDAARKFAALVVQRMKDDSIIQLDDDTYVFDRTVIVKVWSERLLECLRGLADFTLSDLTSRFLAKYFYVDDQPRGIALRDENGAQEWVDYMLEELQRQQFVEKRDLAQVFSAHHYKPFFYNHDGFNICFL